VNDATQQVHDGDELRARWVRWEALPYPRAQHSPGSDEGEVAGVDLALTDGDVAAVFAEYFQSGTNTEFEATREYAADALRRTVPSLDGPARAYFGEALAILEAIIAGSESESGSAPTTTAPEAHVTLRDAD
jgi:hypothetical protein